jgi:hypothetical protein
MARPEFKMSRIQMSRIQKEIAKVAMHLLFVAQDSLLSDG